MSLGSLEASPFHVYPEPLPSKDSYYFEACGPKDPILQGFGFFFNTVDDRNPALPFRTLNYGSYGIFLSMGNEGFVSSAIVALSPKPQKDPVRSGL